MNLEELENSLLLAVQHSGKYQNEDPRKLIQQIKAMKKDFQEWDIESSHNDLGDTALFLIINIFWSVTRATRFE